MDDVSDLSCPECGAMVAGDRRDFHLEWHARITAALTRLAARQDGIPPRRGDHG